MELPAYRTAVIRVVLECLPGRTQGERDDRAVGRSGGAAAQDSERGLRLFELYGARGRPAEPRALVERRHPREGPRRGGAEVGDTRAELPRGLAGRRPEAATGGGPERAPVEGRRSAACRARSTAAVAPRPNADDADGDDDRERA